MCTPWGFSGSYLEASPGCQLRWETWTETLRTVGCCAVSRFHRSGFETGLGRCIQSVGRPSSSRYARSAHNATALVRESNELSHTNQLRPGQLPAACGGRVRGKHPDLHTVWKGVFQDIDQSRRPNRHTARPVWILPGPIWRSNPTKCRVGRTVFGELLH